MIKELMTLKTINLTPSKNQFVLLSLSIIIITSVCIISNNGDSDYNSSSLTVFAQIEENTTQKMLVHSQLANSNSTINADSTTFASIGTISSLVITVPEQEFNITNAFKVILTGDWVLNVNNGTVKNFEVNFLASPMDGSRGHIHQITNLSTNENEPIQLTPENDSFSINGTADIKINGITIWKNVDLSVTISKYSTISIDPNDRQTYNHFGDQQVYGIVNRFIVM